MIASVNRAVRSLWRETIGFRMSYSLEIVPGAEHADSFRYYIYSDRLFLEHLEFDSQGVPLKQYRLLGPQYNPLFVAWWGLHHLERAQREFNNRYVDIFLAQIGWLRANWVARSDGAVVWPCNFDWQEGRAQLEAPWISAMYQGVVISALVRGFRIAGDKKLLELARAGAIVFSLDVNAGGVRSHEADKILFEEYPAFPLPRILDGFLFSLLGLYDLYVQTGDDEVRRLFEDGVEGLISHLWWWDYRGKWSWYGAHGYLCPPHYHTLNAALLTILHRLTEKQALKDMADAWTPLHRPWFDRIEVFVAFVLTKNLARLRLPNEKGT